MARYTNTIPTKASPTELADSIRAYLESQGFKQLEQDPHTWQKGGLFFSNPSFIRFEVAAGQLKLEAWLKFLILPGVSVSEYDLEGLFLIIPKRALKGHVAEIERRAR